MTMMCEIMFVWAVFLTTLSICIFIYKNTEAIDNYLTDKSKFILTDADLAGIKITNRISILISPFYFIARHIFHLLHIKRANKANGQLLDAIYLLKNALKSGLSFPQSLEMASIEMKSPLGEEIRRAVARLKLGETVEDALSEMEKRLPVENISLVVQSVLALRRSGGNIVESFGTLAETIEARIRVENKIKILTAQGVYQGIALLTMPWVLGIMIYMIAPEYISPLIEKRLGNFLILCGVILETLGALWLKKIVMIKV